MKLFPAHTTWDIFCRVIDNYGDIGVCWRLARQLAYEHKQRVRLWVDDLSSFQRICSEIDITKLVQQVSEVTVCVWTNGWQMTTVADIVIEAFACDLPASYVEAMAQADKPILWLNLEYLTYEHWSESCHGLPSLQANGLSKYFFFTGLASTGGIIRESNVIESLQAFQQDITAQAHFLSQLQVVRRPDALLTLVFSYHNHALGSWLACLEQSDQAYQLLIPQTPLLLELSHYLQLDQAQLVPGFCYQKGNVSVQIIPFVDQLAFDKLLSCCDFTLVRGEDSFVRAQLVGKPMLWHIYPQQDQAHLIKLNAFMSYYFQGLTQNTEQAATEVWLAWNQQENMADAWLAYQQHWSELVTHAEKWAESQKTVTDLVSRLANFYQNWLS